MIVVSPRHRLPGFGYLMTRTPGKGSRGGGIRTHDFLLPKHHLATNVGGECRFRFGATRASGAKEGGAAT